MPKPAEETPTHLGPPKNYTLTIHGPDGGTTTANIDDEQAELLRRFQTYAERPSKQLFPPERGAARRRNREACEDRVGTLLQALTPFADLDKNDWVLIMALVDLIRTNAREYDGGDWVFQLVRTLLTNTSCDGPTRVNELDPSFVIDDLADEYGTFQHRADQAREWMKRHPDLRPAAPRTLPKEAAMSRGALIGPEGLTGEVITEQQHKYLKACLSVIRDIPAGPMLDAIRWIDLVVRQTIARCSALTTSIAVWCSVSRPGTSTRPTVLARASRS